MILARTLRELQFEVLEAVNGLEAARLMESGGEPVGLALVDWNMPEMSGYDLLLHLRSRPEWSSLVIVMVTTETDLDRMSAALAAGANEYVMKPFTREILVEKLQMAGVAV